MRIAVGDDSPRRVLLDVPRFVVVGFAVVMVFVRWFVVQGCFVALCVLWREGCGRRAAAGDDPPRPVLLDDLSVVVGGVSCCFRGVFVFGRFFCCGGGGGWWWGLGRVRAADDDLPRRPEVRFGDAEFGVVHFSAG